MAAQAAAPQGRMAVVGLGQIGMGRHLPAICANRHFALAGVCDPHSQFDGVPAPGFRSHEDMLRALPGLDAIAICTPPAMRAGVARDALKAGCHVMLEKPPALDQAELSDLEHVAAKAGRVLFTAWHSQHNEAVEAARLLLASQAIANVHVVWHEDWQKYHSGQDWIWRKGGFGVLDPGINAISILTRILPALARVRSSELTIPSWAETPIAARIELCFEAADGYGQLDLDWQGGSVERREISVTTRAGMRLDLIASGRRLLCDGACVVEGDADEYGRLYTHFAGLLVAGRRDVDGLPLVLAEAALAEGRRIPLESRAGT